MPIGTEEWRAGIACIRLSLLKRPSVSLSVFETVYLVCTVLINLSLFVAFSIFTLPSSLINFLQLNLDPDPYIILPGKFQQLASLQDTIIVLYKLTASCISVFQIALVNVFNSVCFRKKILPYLAPFTLFSMIYCRLLVSTHRLGDQKPLQFLLCLLVTLSRIPVLQLTVA